LRCFFVLYCISVEFLKLKTICYLGFFTVRYIITICYLGLFMVRYIVTICYLGVFMVSYIVTICYLGLFMVKYSYFFTGSLTGDGVSQWNAIKTNSPGPRTEVVYNFDSDMAPEEGHAAIRSNTKPIFSNK
jgi:hypothetical protein